MGEYVNRDMQRVILNELAHDYPAFSDTDMTFGPQVDNALKVNMAYLEEHGLIVCKRAETLEDPYPLPHAAKISAAGLDFLADDGGLSAVLGVVTIRFDEEQIRSLFLEKIEAADADPNTKQRLVETIRGMPADALKRLSQRAIEYGLDQGADAIHALAQAL